MQKMTDNFAQCSLACTTTDAENYDRSYIDYAGQVKGISAIRFIAYLVNRNSFPSNTLKVIYPSTNHKIIPRYNRFSMAFGIFSRIFPPLWSQELLKKALSHHIGFRGNNACLHYESVPITWSYWSHEAVWSIESGQTTFHLNGT